MRELKRLHERARPYRARFWAGVACSALVSAFGYITPKVAEQVVELLQQAPELDARGVLGSWLLVLGVGLPLLALLKGILSYGSTYLVAGAAQGVLADLRADLYRSLVDRPVAWLAKRPTAELVSRVTNDVQRLESGLTLRLPDLLQNAPTAAVVVVVLWLMNPRLALVATVLVPIAALLVRRWSSRLRRASRASQQHTGSLAGILSETLGGVRIVKAYLAERREVARFDAFNENLRRSNMRSIRTLAASAPIMDTLGALLMAALIAVAALEILARRLTTAEAVAFVTAMTLLYQSTKKTTNAINELQNTSAAAQRSFELLDESDLGTEAIGRLEVSPLRDSIEFRRVTFAHESLPVVKDFDLRVRRGEVVALVGESGAGKTTLTNLLVRFHDPGSGAILWDGVDLREVSTRSLRSHVGLVTQDVIVFDDTVLRNIAYGDAEPDRARAELAARAACAHDFVAALPQGYDTPLGERGNRLSGGQRQRLAIARALYKDAPVLILDEATSALDSQSESQLQQALARLIAGRTVFIVAHRLATVMAADRIVVMSEGRIVQQGTHDELLLEDGTYRRLHRLQSGR